MVTCVPPLYWWHLHLDHSPNTACLSLCPLVRHVISCSQESPDHDAEDEQDDDDEFEFGSDIELDEAELLEQLGDTLSSYLRPTNESASGKESKSMIFLKAADAAGFTAPPLPATAKPLPPRKADFVNAPACCVDDGVYLIVSEMARALFGKDEYSTMSKAVDTMYLDEPMLTQWKPGRALPAGTGLACKDIAASVDKLKDAHQACTNEPEIAQVSSTGAPIMQCFEHKSKPTRYCHIKLAAYWYNFTSSLVAKGFPLRTSRSIWQSAIRPRMLLLKYGLLGELYIQQSIDHIKLEAAKSRAVDQGIKLSEADLPAGPRLRYRALDDESPVLPSAMAHASKAAKGIQDPKQRKLSFSMKGSGSGKKGRGKGGKGYSPGDSPNKQRKRGVEQSPNQGSVHSLADVSQDSAKDMSPASAKKLLVHLLRQDKGDDR
jgi:hypothetical protein